jgi:hypothetical protein
MMMNPDFEFKQHLHRRDALLKAVRIEQLMRDADTNRAHLPKRLLLLLSDVMIDGGVRLKNYVRNTSVPRSLTGPEAHLELIQKL